MQDIEADGLSDHLSVLADSLNKARNIIHPRVKKPSKHGDSFISLSAVVENEHKRLLARKSIIEKRKEELERQILEKVVSEYPSSLRIGLFGLWLVFFSGKGRGDEEIEIYKENCG